jgi:hypothetical protein
MTNAISLNANIFHDAEQTAHRLGISLNKLSSLAITEFLQTHSQGHPAKLPGDLMQMQYDMFDREDW